MPTTPVPLDVRSERSRATRQREAVLLKLGRAGPLRPADVALIIRALELHPRMNDRGERT